MLIRENATRTAAKRLRKRWEIFVFIIILPFYICHFVELVLETSRWDDYWEAAYHTGISSFPIYLLDFGGPVSCCNIIIPHPTEKEKSVSCK